MDFFNSLAEDQPFFASGSGGPSGSKPTTKSEKVFTRYFRAAQPQLLKYFEELTYGQETAFSRIASDTFDKVVKLCKVMVDNIDKEELRDFFIDVGEAKLGGGSVKVNFEDVCGIINTWSAKHKPPVAMPTRRSKSVMNSKNRVVHNSSNFFEAKVSKAILDFEALMKQTPKEIQYINKILEVMKDQLSQYKHSRKRELRLGDIQKDVTKEEYQGIESIFRWYAQQHQNSLFKPTFEDMRHQQETMDHGTFIRFATDFSIIAPYSGTTRVLKRDELIKIFKKHATFQKDMNQDQFVESLDAVADLYYNGLYDDINPSANASNRPIEQKRMFLYQHLQAGDPKYFAKVRRPFGQAFASGIDTGARMTKNAGYRPIKSENKLAQLEEFKQRKLDSKRLEAERLVEEERQRQIRAKKMAREQQADRLKRRKAQEDRRRKAAEIKKMQETKQEEESQTVVKVEEIEHITYKELKGNENDLTELIKENESDDEDEDEDYYESFVRGLTQHSERQE